jgi:ribosomal protein L11 methyltransferase
VLAIAAAHLGWDPVEGVDHEVAAIEAAEGNAAANGVELTLRRVNLREEVPPAAPTVVANLTAPLLLELARRIGDGSVEPPQTMVLSGLLAGEAERVTEAFAAAGLRREADLPVGEWMALLLRR